MDRNRLIHGDNLRAMQDMSSCSVDMIYMDPPFYVGRVHRARAGSFDDRFGTLDSYLEMIQPRIDECRRLLSDRGSLFVHCNTKASHYLKIMLDKTFGRSRFVNELIWCHDGISSCKTRFPHKHDTIFWYSAGTDYTFNLFASSIRRPYKHPITPRRMMYGNSPNRTEDECRELTKRGRLIFSWWADIERAGNIAGERCGYPTQKPVKLLHRLIEAASNPGDLVLDPFCGSGTTLVAAKRLERDWIGIDESGDAIIAATRRLKA